MECEIPNVFKMLKHKNESLKPEKPYDMLYYVLRFPGIFVLDEMLITSGVHFKCEK